MFYLEIAILLIEIGITDKIHYSIYCVVMESSRFRAHNNKINFKERRRASSREQSSAKEKEKMREMKHHNAIIDKSNAFLMPYSIKK